MKKILLFLSLALVLTSCTNWASEDTQTSQDTITVTSTITPFASIANYIGGEKVEVNSIIQPGFSPHSFEMKPSDIKNLQNSDLILSTGLEIDNFIVENISEKNILQLKDFIELLEWHDHHNHSEDVHNEDEHHEDEHYEDEHHEDEHHENEEIFFDPHFWLSLENGDIIAEKITESLSQLDPENKQYYETNLENFKKESWEIKNNFSLWSDSQDFIIFHEAFNYLFTQFGILDEKVLVLEETAGREPSVWEMKTIIDEINERSIKVIYKEPQFESKLIDTLQSQHNLETYILDPLWNSIDKNGYLNNIESNLNNLKNLYE